MRSFRDHHVAIGLGVVVALAALPLAGIALTWPNADEFVVGYDARRLLLGEVPYRDFHMVEPPGGVALHALLYRLVGPSQLASRLLAVAVGGAIATVALLLARRLGAPRWSAAAGAVAAGLGLLVLWPYPTPHAAAALCSLGAIGLAVGGDRRRTHFAAAGLLIGLAFLFHPVVALAGGVSIALVAIDHPMRRGAVPAALACFALLALLLAALALIGAAGPAFRCAAWAFSHYTAAGGFNDVAFGAGVVQRTNQLGADAGPLAAGAFFVLAMCVLGGAIVVGMLAAALVLFRRATRRDPPALHPLAALLAGSFVLLGLLLRQRPDLVHIGFATLLLFPAAAALPASVGRSLILTGRTLVAVAALAALVLLVARLAAAPSIWPRLDSAVAEWPEMQMIRDLTTDADRIAVFPGGGVYYAYARRAGVGYTWLLPPADHYHDAHDYQKVADELTLNRARLVFITTPEAFADFTTNAGALSATLRRDFKLVRTPSGVPVLLRR